MDKKLSLVIYCDGGARGNPGPAAAAFVVVQDGRVIHQESKFLGQTTNNVAEYEALVMALRWLVSRKGPAIERTVVNLDSELIARQMSGQYRVKSANLKPHYLLAKKYEKQLDGKIVYRWTSRSKNRLADFLVNKNLDANI